MKTLRRAVLFSLLSVFLSGFVILLFWGLSTTRLDRSVQVAETRVVLDDRMVNSWDAFVIDASRASLRAALRNLSLRVTPSTGTFTQAEVRDHLRSCLLTGTTHWPRAVNPFVSCFDDGKNQSLAAKLDAFNTILNNHTGIAGSYRIDATSFSVSDAAPFEIRIAFSLNSSFVDPSFARWNRSRSYTIVVPVDGLPDPLFRHYGALWLLQPNRNITRSPVSRDLLSKSGVENMVANGSYVDNFGLGPTYLERFSGNLSGPLDSANVAGIESLLLPEGALPASLPPSRYKNTSFADYQVFQNLSFVCGVETFALSGFSPSSFHLDAEHLARYNFNSSSVSYSCS